MKKLLFLCGIAFAFSCNTHAQQGSTGKKEPKTYPVSKTDAQWRAALDDMEYYVLRQKGTEPPGNNAYNKLYKEGVYLCAGCGIKLYESIHKYNSGSGWPAFDRGVEKHLEYETDTSHGMIRTEVRCANCGGHLGHVFDDGPEKTTGKRHCINSAALDFVPAKPHEPEKVQH
jgi:peptide-methionine (R)-S-oxide reductase